MKNRNFTDEQLDSVIEYLEGNTYSLDDALQEVLGVPFEELTYEDYKYFRYEIVRCISCDLWCKEVDIRYTGDGIACEECADYLEEEGKWERNELFDIRYD